MKKTKKYEEGGKTILDRSKGKLVSKSEYAASRAKPAAKAPSRVLDRDRMGMTPAAPKPAPKVAKPEAPARKSPITANFTKTGEQFKPNPLKRTKPKTATTSVKPAANMGPPKPSDATLAFRKRSESIRKQGELAAKADAAKKTKPAASPEYKRYAKSSTEAKDFRSSFAAARKAGDKVFTWQGRKYSTDIA